VKTLTRILAPAVCVAALATLAIGLGHVEVIALDGMTEGDLLGSAVAWAGDVNGDGFDDVIVGAPNDGPAEDGAGAAYVISGQDGAILHVFEGSAPGESLGAAVSGTGDVDRDGFDDVVVLGGGKAHVYSGLTGSLLYTFSPASTVGRAGDVNADGWDDILVGATQDDPGRTDSGTARVYSGRDGKVIFTFHGFGTGDWFGYAVCGAGDINRDGYADIAVGAPRFDPKGIGFVKVFSGANGYVLRTLHGDAAGHRFGTSLSSAGDVNRDGFEDLIVGSEYVGYAAAVGIARVLSGKDGTTLHTFSGEYESDRFGCSVGGGADVNGDGYPDLIVGAPAAGRAPVYSGKDGSRIYNLRGQQGLDEQFGFAVAMADLDHDGLADLIVGAPWAAMAGPRSGRVSVRISDATLDGDAPTLRGFRVNEGRGYVLPGEPLRFEIDADDGPMGTGVDAFRASFDGGSTWTAWLEVDGATPVEVAHPGVFGLRRVQVVVRDEMWNESATLEAPLSLLTADPICMGCGGRVVGQVSVAGEVDVVSVDLAAGDSLSVKLKAKAMTGKARFEVGLDLIDACDARLVTGCFPTAGKPGIKGFVAPLTGRYRIVVRTEATSPVSTGLYSLSVKSKQARANRKVRGEGLVTAIPFEAVAGSTLKGTLVAEGLSTGSITLVGPDGVNAYDFAGTGKKVKVMPVVLDRGSGTYELRFDAAANVAWKLTVKPPARSKAKFKQ